MLNIPKYERIGNQNCKEASPHTTQNAMNKKCTNNKCSRGHGRKGALLCFWWDCNLIITTMEKRMEVPQTVNTQLPYDSAVPLLATHVDKSITGKGTCTPMFIAALFRIGKTWKQPKCPLTEEWVKNMCYIYTMELLLL